MTERTIIPPTEPTPETEERDAAPVERQPFAKPTILQPFNPAEVIGTAKAARQAGRSERTMREWCVAHKIGRLIGKRWAVSQVALDMLLNGDKEGLAAYHAGDRTSPRVRSYYERRSIPLPSVFAASADYADAS